MITFKKLYRREGAEQCLLSENARCLEFVFGLLGLLPLRRTTMKAQQTTNVTSMKWNPTAALPRTGYKRLINGFEWLRQFSLITLSHSPVKLLIPQLAWVAESADAPDLKSVGPQGSWGFNSPSRHFIINGLQEMLTKMLTKKKR